MASKKWAISNHTLDTQGNRDINIEVTVAKRCRCPSN